MSQTAPRFRWSIASPQCELQQQLVAGCGVSALLAQCLINRGHTIPEKVSAFLEPLLKNLADPFLLPDMSVAVKRILQARTQGDKIVVFGDYDVDGVTSTAILLEVLEAFGCSAEAYLPSRMDEGYGLSDEAVVNCVEKCHPQLLLAVDCGSTSVAQIEWLRQRNVDVLVLDHHQISVPAPAPIALVNPKKSTDGASQELCSAGLAFKLAHALVKSLRETGAPEATNFDLKPLLDLVALGTIADIVPLIGENRIFASRGMDRISNTKRPGLIALKSVAQTGETIGVHDVGFQLAPRLNAAGRLENAQQALTLLRAPSVSVAEPLAAALDACNRDRQKIEKTIAAEAATRVRSVFNPETDFVIVEGDSTWHIGVVGIVASRVMHEFYRPSIILGGEGSEWRGSGRSIEGFDIAAALRECSDLLVKHGGHAMAAGLTILPEKVAEFRQRLNEVAARHLSREMLRPKLRLDAEVSLAELTLDYVKELQRLKPFGPSNPGIQLVARGLTHQRAPQRMGRENQHAKFWVTDGTQTLEAVWWGCGADAVLPKVMMDLAFVPDINEYNGRSSVQLKVLDWSPVA